MGTDSKTDSEGRESLPKPLEHKPVRVVCVTLVLLLEINCTSKARCHLEEQNWDYVWKVQESRTLRGKLKSDI